MSIRYNLSWAQELAATKGGECLSTEYINSLYRYRWKCSEGHQWVTSAGSIQQGHWCPYCAGQGKHNVQWLQELASRHNGICLSTRYKSYQSDYQWQCHNGHEWSARASNVVNGTWCPRCADRRHNIEWCRELAVDRGGLCLSEEYIIGTTKYQWKCGKGHIWRAAAVNILRGHWCPRCAQPRSKKEFTLYNYVKLTHPHAISGSYKVLKNRNFQLDIYVPSLKKAIEFDGTFWHKSAWAVSHGVPERDARKDLQCKEAGIALLRIPEEEFDADLDAVKAKIDLFLRS